MSAADSDNKAENEEKSDAGELLYCGGTNFKELGRKGGSLPGNLLAPTRIKSLIGVDIRFVASGCGEDSFLLSPFLYFSLLGFEYGCRMSNSASSFGNLRYCYSACWFHP